MITYTAKIGSRQIAAHEFSRARNERDVVVTVMNRYATSGDVVTVEADGRIIARYLVQWGFKGNGSLRASKISEEDYAAEFSGKSLAEW